MSNSVRYYSVLQRFPESARRRAFGYSPTPAHVPSPTSGIGQMDNLDHLVYRLEEKLMYRIFPKLALPRQQKTGSLDARRGRR